MQLQMPLLLMLSLMQLMLLLGLVAMRVRGAVEEVAVEVGMVEEVGHLGGVGDIRDPAEVAQGLRSQMRQLMVGERPHFHLARNVEGRASARR